MAVSYNPIFKTLTASFYVLPMILKNNLLENSHLRIY